MATITDWLPDIGLGAAFFALLGLGSLAGLYTIGKRLFGLLKNGQPILLYDAVAFIGAAVFSCLFSYAIVSNVRRDHWLRVGTARYTVATVTRSYYSRSGRKFVFTYRAGPHSHETYGECGNAPCPPAGARRFVRFAVEAPDVCAVLAAPVPDTLSVVPPGGWAQLSRLSTRRPNQRMEDRRIHPH